MFSPLPVLRGAAGGAFSVSDHLSPSRPPEAFAVLEDDGEDDTCDPGQSLRLGSLCDSRAVSGYALPPIQQRRRAKERSKTGQVPRTKIRAGGYDTTRTHKTAYQRNRMQFAQRNLRRDKDRRNMIQFNLQTLPKSAKQKERERIRPQKKFQKQFGVRQKWDQKSQKPRDSSVEVRSDWEVKEEMDFPQLMKMHYLEVSEPQAIECCGALEYYDKAFDCITTRSEKPLRSIKRIFHTVTTTDDPVIRKLAKTKRNVFATDAILATLSCTRSVYSWDIVVQRVGSKLFFDKRDNSDFDLLIVNETTNEPPQDEAPLPVCCAAPFNLSQFLPWLCPHLAHGMQVFKEDIQLPKGCSSSEESTELQFEEKLSGDSAGRVLLTQFVDVGGRNPDPVTHHSPLQGPRRQDPRSSPDLALLPLKERGSTPSNRNRQPGLTPNEQGIPERARPIASGEPKQPDVTSGVIKWARHPDVSLASLGRPVPGAKLRRLWARPP
ncbi:Eukaryotic translation initiation factor 3 subunit D [Heterocephalus glaber]|uniref:Eukaryotic translation initiation factor 3 subunit D n=1 Tax=Heterocephalus glaber TaxID=10181 RepID=G5BU26_HETGA|nr:Eukaryotic translation initiation factor 3 subunit D [Heterocephalus glaber]